MSDQDLLEFPDSSHRKQPASPVSDGNQMHDIVMQSIEDGAMLNELISIQDSASEELSIIKPLLNDECDEMQATVKDEIDPNAEAVVEQ